MWTGPELHHVTKPDRNHIFILSPASVTCHVACHKTLKVFNFFRHVEKETATGFRSVDGLSRVLATCWTFIRSSSEMAFRQFVSLSVMDGTTHRSHRGTSDNSYDTPSGHCYWCPSIVVLSRQKLIGDSSMNACIQHDHASTSPPASDNACSHHCHCQIR